MKLYSLGKWVPKVGKERIYRRVAKEGRGGGRTPSLPDLNKSSFPQTESMPFFDTMS